MSLIDGTPLGTLTGMPRGLQKALNAAGIATIEQLVGSTAGVGGAAKMAGHLGVGVTEFRRVLAEAVAALPPGDSARLKIPADPSEHGLGALPPDEVS